MVLFKRYIIKTTTCLQVFSFENGNVQYKLLNMYHIPVFIYEWYHSEVCEVHWIVEYYNITQRMV